VLIRFNENTFFSTKHLAMYSAGSSSGFRLTRRFMVAQPHISRQDTKLSRV
jgi:hypothetical protein